MSAISTGLGLDLGTSTVIARTCSNINASQEELLQNHPGSLRSASSMRGLLQAEAGDSMVEMDVSNGASGFREGRRIVPDIMTPFVESANAVYPQNFAPVDDHQTTLFRHGTLLSANSTPSRNAAELKTVLGNANSRLKPGASIVPLGAFASTDRTDLEQAKPRARVEVDVIPECHIFVQGGYLNGVVKIRIRERSRKESTVLISDGKLRVIGFECIQNQVQRYTFYQQSAMLSATAPSCDRLFDSAPDNEGFYYAKEGVHSLPFTMLLSLDEGEGKPKGTIAAHAGISVRYIIMISVKVKERETDRRSIAHFYRDCEVWPRLNPSAILSPAPQPIRNASAKSLFMGGSGKVGLTASLHRLHWIAGQYCCIKIRVINQSKKTVKSLTLTLLRSTVVFKPKNHLDVDGVDDERDADACQTSTIQKQVAESTLDMGQRHGSRGHASAKGWWTGIHAGETAEFMHFLRLPPDDLSIPRSRLLEIEYNVRVTINAGPLNSDVYVLLPIRIINFLSVDPPPAFPPPDEDMLKFLDRKSLPAVDDDNNMLHKSQTLNGRTLGSLEESEIAEDESAVCTDINDGQSLSSRSSSVSENLDTLSANKQLSQLGTVQVRDDNDEFVQQAITSVRIDSKYGEHGGRFADLYYASAQEGLSDTGLSEVDVDQSNLESATPRSGSHLASPHSSSSSGSSLNEICHEPTSTRGPSSFADRVKQKMRAAKENRRAQASPKSSEDEEHIVRETIQLDGTNSTAPSRISRDTYLNSTDSEIQGRRSSQGGQNMMRNRSSTAGSYFRSRNETLDEIEKPNDRADIGQDYDEAKPISRLLELTRKTGEISVTGASSSGNRLQEGNFKQSGSEDTGTQKYPVSTAQFHYILPEHCLGSHSTAIRREVGFRPRAQTLSAPRTSISANKDSVNGTQAARPPIQSSSVGSTNSVKDRIRRLEEKAKTQSLEG